MKKIVCLFLFLIVLTARAEEDGKSDFSIGADVVSTYVWRGSYQAGTSIQPFMEYKTGGFTALAWGSVDVAGFGYKEVDIAASYTYKNLTVGLFDYWVAGEKNYRYFDFSKTTLHLLDAWLSYTFDCIPLSISWNTVIAGDNTFTKQDKKKVFPTYIEMTRFFSVKDVQLEAAVGISPWNSYAMYNRYDEGGRTDGFAVVNLSLKASKDIKISDKYSLPIFGQLILNPAKEDAFLVFGLKF